MKAFGKRLKELRMAKNMGQLEFGELIDKSRSTIANYENGSREPNFDTLNEISKIFNVTTDYLLGNVEESSLNYRRVHVKDTSMNLIVEDAGDYYSAIRVDDEYIILSSSNIKSGDIVLVYNDNDYLVRIIHKSETGLILQAIDDKNDIDFYPIEDQDKIRILGKIVETRKIY